MKRLDDYFFGGQPSTLDGIIFYSFVFGGSALGALVWVVNALV